MKGSRQDESSDGEEQEEFDGKRTLAQVLVNDRKKGFGSGREITFLINNIQQAIKSISQLLRSYGLFKGMQTGKLSVKSFDQKNLLKKCEAIFFKSLASSPTVCLMGSSYSNELIEINNTERGKFVVTFVPLEGNLSLNYRLVSGSIFSMYKKLNKESVSKDDMMQSGSCLQASGYALYGVTTVLVLALAQGAGVYEFVLDPDTNEFVIKEKLQLPLSGPLYSLNEGRSRSTEITVWEALNRKKAINVTRGRILKCVYTGSIVADTHSIIKEGGLLVAPPYTDYPQGMAKLQFVGNPLGFLVIEAGGAASDGEKEITDVFVDDPHQHRPLYFGSLRDHQEFSRIYTNALKMSRPNIF